MPLPPFKFFEDEIVYHLSSNKPGVVTGYLIEGNNVKYQVEWQGLNESFHTGGSLTRERPYYVGNGDDDDELV